MDKRTIAYALQVLDSQCRYMNEGGKQSNRIQKAYYDGRRRMFELILTEAGTNGDCYLTFTKEGHKIMSYT